MPTPMKSIAVNGSARLDELIQVLIVLENTILNRKQQYEKAEAELIDIMLDCGLERYVGEKGEALLTSSTSSDWMIQKLENVLTRKEFNTYCPRSPDGGALTKYRQSIAANEPLCRALDKCRTNTVREKVAVASATEVAERKKPVATSMMPFAKLEAIKAARKTRKASADAIARKTRNLARFRKG